MLETLKSLDALGEMNLSNLSKMAQKLPVPLQYRWRDRAQKFRDEGHLPKLSDLVDFVERAADAANDPFFGRIADNRNKGASPTAP